MKQAWQRVWTGEPVALFAFLATIVPLVTSGLVVFGAWHPTVEQLAYVDGVPAIVALAFGIRVTRAKVAPFDG